MITPSNVIGILQLGFHAAALAFLYLGFQLMRQAITQAKSARPTSVPRLEIVLKSIRQFILISFFFFIVGAGIELFSRVIRPQVNVSVTTTPQLDHFPSFLSKPDISVNGDSLTWKGGYAKTQVSETTTIIFSTEALVESGRNLYLALSQYLNAEIPRTSAGALSAEGGL